MLERVVEVVTEEVVNVPEINQSESNTEEQAVSHKRGSATIETFYLEQ
jgi:hypothetical protein